MPFDAGKINAVVISYNPEHSIYDNILAIASQVEKVIIVDNGSKDKSFIDIIADIENVEVIMLSENHGIAHALNVGLVNVNENTKWIATFDQDTLVKDNYMFQLISELDDYLNISGDKIEDIGIVCGNFEHYGGSPEDGRFSIMGDSITSGSIINRNVLKYTGGFDDGMFIDYVDIDFSFRIILGGYRIIKVNNVFMNHHLGEMKAFNLMRRSIITSNHNSLRKFYISRNRIYLYRKYRHIFPKWFRRDVKQTPIEMIKILLFEDQKIDKLTMIFRGLSAGMAGRMGKFDGYCTTNSLESNILFGNDDVDFIVNTFERTYREVLAPGLIGSRSTQSRYDFSRIIIIINNVRDRDDAERRAGEAVSRGEIDQFCFVEDRIASAMSRLNLKPKDLGRIPYYSDWAYVAVTLGGSRWFVHWDAEVDLVTPVDWITPALKLMKSRDDIFTANPTWRKGASDDNDLAEATKSTDDFSIGYGFSDQLFLGDRTKMIADIYREHAPISLRYPLSHITSPFEQAVDSYMRNHQMKRATYRQATYVHPENEGVTHPAGSLVESIRKVIYRYFVAVLRRTKLSSKRWSI